VVPAAHSTQIQNVYESGRRRQRMPQRAARLTHQHLPDAWRATPLVLLGPVAGELDDSLAAVFSGSVFGVGAQGWLRETAPDDTVQPVHPDDWADEAVLKGATALFLSDEDVPPDDAAPALKRWCGMVDIVAFTRGYDGADVCYDGEWRHIDAFPANAVDPTGAGDVFAAAFLIRLGETKDPWESARFASCAASFVVAGEGVAAIPGRQQVEELLAQQPEPQ
jgi:sugar/nucleoside kinase (ribokinase family)